MSPSSSGSARKGKAVEHLVAASCVLASGGELNALTALVDDEGVDVTFKRRDGTRTLDVQVKARFSDEDGSRQLREEEVISSDVRLATFVPRADLYMLFVAVDGGSASFGPVWFVPSRDFAEKGLFIKATAALRIRTSSRAEASGKWREYRLEREELAPAILTALAALEHQ